MEQTKNKSLEKISSNSNETNDFHQYLSLFEDIELPVILDKSYFRYEFLSKKKPIDTAIVSLFIEKFEEAYLFDYYTFYPVGKFNVSSSIKGIIYAKIGVAGGADELFILNLYSTNGEKMDELIVGMEAGDLGFISQITSVISQSKISLIETEFKGSDDDDDDYHEVSKEEKQYRIDTVHGKIEALKE
jgi:hypothetical protein